MRIYYLSCSNFIRKISMKLITLFHHVILLQSHTHTHTHIYILQNHSNHTNPLYTILRLKWNSWLCRRTRLFQGVLCVYFSSSVFLPKQGRIFIEVDGKSSIFHENNHARVDQLCLSSRKVESSIEGHLKSAANS
jgi:hypothetical protein